MKRKILLIKGYSQTKDVLEYDRKTISLYYKLFTSTAGGVSASQIEKVIKT